MQEEFQSINPYSEYSTRQELSSFITTFCLRNFVKNELTSWRLEYYEDDSWLAYRPFAPSVLFLSSDWAPLIHTWGPSQPAPSLKLLRTNNIHTRTGPVTLRRSMPGLA